MCGDGVVAADLRAGGSELRHRLTIGPVWHRQREQPLHRRPVVVGKVGVAFAWGDGAGADEGEGRERGGMVEHGDLGDHPADADPREVRGPAAERVDEGRRVGGEVAQRVGGGTRVRRRRFAAVTQVVARHMAPADGEALAQRVGPGQHGRPAREQDERGVVLPEGLDAQRDSIGFDGGHRSPHGDGRRGLVSGWTGPPLRFHRVAATSMPACRGSHQEWMRRRRFGWRSLWAVNEPGGFHGSNS